MSDVQTVDIWTYNRRLTRRLLIWSGLSVGAGAALQATSSPLWRAFGQQAIGWGVIDGLIAWFGQRSATKKEISGDPAAAPKQRRQLRLLLWLNAGLDLFYMLGGLRLARSGDRARRGHGWGIVVQGAFLFFFDLVHALGMAKMK